MLQLPYAAFRNGWLVDQAHNSHHWRAAAIDRGPIALRVNDRALRAKHHRG